MPHKLHTKLEPCIQLIPENEIIDFFLSWEKTIGEKGKNGEKGRKIRVQILFFIFETNVNVEIKRGKVVNLIKVNHVTKRKKFLHFIELFFFLEFFFL